MLRTIAETLTMSLMVPGVTQLILIHAGNIVMYPTAQVRPHVDCINTCAIMSGSIISQPSSTCQPSIAYILGKIAT